MKNYTGVCISDIHFGVIDSDILKEELYEIFIKYLLNMDKIDYIIIAGDFFDHKIYLNDNTSNHALSFMNSLVDIAKFHKCPIRLVYGTESHEVGQYNIFSMYENDLDIDFKVIMTVTEEYLYKDLFILYIPEEYILDKKIHYADYLYNDKKYDYIFGHGVIEEVMVQASQHIKKNTDKLRKRAPVFRSNELEDACKGQCYFGHYHINKNINDKVFSVGSFTRWMHGEEEDKGFYKISRDNDNYTNYFIVNELAKKYVTITFPYDSSIFTTDDIVTELNKMEKVCDICLIDNVRYIFNIPENHSNPETIINILNDRYKYNDKAKVQIVNGYIEKRKRVAKEEIDSKFDGFSFIFEHNMKLEDKLVCFIKKVYDKDIDVDNIKNYLYTDNSGVN